MEIGAGLMERPLMTPRAWGKPGGSPELCCCTPVCVEPIWRGDGPEARWWFPEEAFRQKFLRWNSTVRELKKYQSGAALSLSLDAVRRTS